jgi:shikimate dehydrogenase
MKRVALFGFPAAHSVSPAMHNAAFAALRLPWAYSAIEVTPEELADWIEQMRGADWAGANVTVPHKVAAADRMDELADTARKIGAINTIVNEDGRLVGHNTDAEGFAADLAEQGVEVAGRPAVLLGAGGAARAVAHALVELGASLRIVCRNQEAGRDLTEAFSGAADEPRVHAWKREGFRDAAGGAALIVNATPVGMSPDIDGCPWPADVPMPAGAFIYDLVFNPFETRLVVAARAAGRNACGGLGMLVEQGARSFQLWTGAAPPRSIMKAAARAALEKQDAQIPYSR